MYIYCRHFTVRRLLGVFNKKKEQKKTLIEQKN